PNLPRPGLTFSLAVIGSGLSLAIVGLAPALWIAAVWLAVSGVLFGICPVIGWTLVQTRAPAPVRSRVVALITLGITGLQPLPLGDGAVHRQRLRQEAELGRAEAPVGADPGIERRAVWRGPGDVAFHPLERVALLPGGADRGDQAGGAKRGRNGAHRLQHDAT